MATGKAKVKEVIYENGADINWLQVSNSYKQTIVINSGDLLTGGKQDRMMGETKMSAPGTSDYLKVYCVERGRWDGKVKPFDHRGSANINIKKVMDLSGRQHDVWKEIERQFTSAKMISETWPFIQLYYKDSVVYNDYLKYYTARYRDSDSAYAGFLAITANQIINCELFSLADLTSLAFPGMISSLAQTAQHESKPVLPRQKMETFLNKFLVSEKAQKNFIATHGQLHKYQGKVIHLVAYDD